MPLFPHAPLGLTSPATLIGKTTTTTGGTSFTPNWSALGAAPGDMGVVFLALNNNSPAPSGWNLSPFPSNQTRVGWKILTAADISSPASWADSQQCDVLLMVFRGPQTMTFPWSTTTRQPAAGTDTAPAWTPAAGSLAYGLFAFDYFGPVTINLAITAPAGGVSLGNGAVSTDSASGALILSPYTGGTLGVSGVNDGHYTYFPFELAG